MIKQSAPCLRICIQGVSQFSLSLQRTIANAALPRLTTSSLSPLSPHHFILQLSDLMVLKGLESLNRPWPANIWFTVDDIVLEKQNFVLKQRCIKRFTLFLPGQVPVYLLTLYTILIPPPLLLEALFPFFSFFKSEVESQYEWIHQNVVDLHIVTIVKVNSLIALSSGLSVKSQWIPQVHCKNTQILPVFFLKFPIGSTTSYLQICNICLCWKEKVLMLSWKCGNTFWRQLLRGGFESRGINRFMWNDERMPFWCPCEAW